jgi:alkylation response protein AidB-like acyl-CoA dehydrogenase
MLFEELGWTGRASSLLNRAVARLLDEPPDSSRPVLLPVPGRAVDLDPYAAERRDDELTIDGLILSPGAPAEHLLVVSAHQAGARLDLVPTAALQVVPAGGLDPEARAHRVSGRVMVSGTTDHPRVVDWTRAMATGRLALAAELLGVTKAICALGISHVSSREQFSRPLGSFQSVRHRLAESHVNVSAAASIITIAGQGPDGDLGVASSEQHLWAMAAKAAAGQAFEGASRTVVQVCGAIGLTFEHPLHRLVRRGAVLNGMLGDANALTTHLGSLVLAGSDLPTFDPLRAAR